MARELRRRARAAWSSRTRFIPTRCGTNETDFIIGAPLPEAGRAEELPARRLDEPLSFEICCILFFPYDVALGDVVQTDVGYEFARVVRALRSLCLPRLVRRVVSPAPGDRRSTGRDRCAARMVVEQSPASRRGGCTGGTGHRRLSQRPKRPRALEVRDGPLCVTVSRLGRRASERVSSSVPPPPRSSWPAAH